MKLHKYKILKIQTSKNHSKISHTQACTHPRTTPLIEAWRTKNPLSLYYGIKVIIYHWPNYNNKILNKSFPIHFKVHHSFVILQSLLIIVSNLNKNISFIQPNINFPKTHQLSKSQCHSFEPVPNTTICVGKCPKTSLIPTMMSPWSIVKAG